MGWTALASAVTKGGHNSPRTGIFNLPIRRRHTRYFTFNSCRSLARPHNTSDCVYIRIFPPGVSSGGVEKLGQTADLLDHSVRDGRHCQGSDVYFYLAANKIMMANIPRLCSWWWWCGAVARLGTFTPHHHSIRRRHVVFRSPHHGYIDCTDRNGFVFMFMSQRNRYNQVPISMSVSQSVHSSVRSSTGYNATETESGIMLKR